MMVQQERIDIAAVHAAQKACLMRLATADSVLKRVESHTISAIMQATGAASIDDTPNTANAPLQDITALCALPPVLKQQFMKLLWLLALCDGDLHTEEERLIYQIGDMIGIDRRTLVGTQRFVAVCLDRDGQLAGNC